MATTATTSPMLPATKTSPLTMPAAGEALGQEEQERGGRQQRTPAHAELADLAVARAAPCSQSELDAAQPDREALEQPARRGRRLPAAIRTCRPRGRCAAQAQRQEQRQEQSSGSSQGLPCHSALEQRRARSDRRQAQPSVSQARPKMPSSNPYQGRRAKPTQPTTSQKSSGRRGSARRRPLAALMRCHELSAAAS